MRVATSLQDSRLGLAGAPLINLTLSGTVAGAALICTIAIALVRTNVT